MFNVASGWILEAAFSYEQKFVVFSTADSPYEETLKVSLLGEDKQAVESIELVALYSPGIFQFSSVENDRIHFVFWPEVRMQIELKEEPVYAWQHSKIANVSYNKGFFQKRALVLSK